MLLNKNAGENAKKADEIKLAIFDLVKRKHNIKNATKNIAKIIGCEIVAE